MAHGALIDRYQMNWPGGWSDAQIERECLRMGGHWIHPETKCSRGLGLFQHFKNYWSAVWPRDSQTRWTDLVLKELLENQFVSIIGPGSSWKTGTVARLAMMDYSLFPDHTGILVSSTTMKGLDQRIFSEFKMLWKQAKTRHEWWPGNVVEHKMVITTNTVREDQVRDIRNGIIGVACQNDQGVFLGLGKYVGFKNFRVWSIGDEFQFMQRSILDAQSNLLSNGPLLLPGMQLEGLEKGLPIRGYRAVFIGNPNPSRPENPLHLVSEPEGGWGSIPDEELTHVWNAKQVPDSVVKCRTINLDGADSPNNAYPDHKPQWTQLINRRRLAMYPIGSDAYWSQGRGVVRLGIAAYKIITREICDQFSAFDKDIFWVDDRRTKIGFLDAAYGDGDRCAVGWLEFGTCVDGKIRLLFKPLKLIPIIISDKSPDDQIAIYCKREMEAVGVSAQNFFFDGRGTLATAFAREWSPLVNVLDFGGQPEKRIVNQDIYIDEPDGGRRLKMENEHFSKKVSALWFAWRHAIEADQVRGLTLDVVLDATPREYAYVKGNKIEIETKKLMKKRTGCSPDLADACVCGVEGARQRGFRIGKLNPVPQKKHLEERYGWATEMANERWAIRRSKMLQMN